MFDSPEIKGLRQDVDLVSEQLSKLVEILDSRHADIMMRLELMDEKLDAGFSEDSGQISQSDIEEIRDNTEAVREEVSELAEAIHDITPPPNPST